MKLEIEYIPISEIKAYPNNAKIHTAEQIEQIKKSIQEFGFNDPIGIWHGECVEGHGRVIAATELGIESVPVIRLDGLTDEQRRAYMLIHNKLTMNTDFDVDLLNIELDDITDIDMRDFGFDLDLESEFNPQEEAKGSMKEKYLVPPFSVIYGNKPDWLARKRGWVTKGLRSEIGRGGGRLTFNSRSNPEANFVRGGGATRNGAKPSKTTAGSTGIKEKK